MDEASLFAAVGAYVVGFAVFLLAAVTIGIARFKFRTLIPYLGWIFVCVASAFTVASLITERLFWQALTVALILIPGFVAALIFLARRAPDHSPSDKSDQNVESPSEMQNFHDPPAAGGMGESAHP